MSFLAAEPSFVDMLQARVPHEPAFSPTKSRNTEILPEPNSPEPPQEIIAANGTDTG
jgi:hypothetical protein